MILPLFHKHSLFAFLTTIFTIQHVNGQVSICKLGLTPDDTSKDHVVAIPEKNQNITIVYADDDYLEGERVRCYLRVESCSTCLLKVRLGPTFKQKDTTWKCNDWFRDSCVDIRVIEERADSALSSEYSRTSLWDFENGEYTSSGNSLIFSLDLSNAEHNASIIQYIRSHFPLFVSSISSEEIIEGGNSTSINNSSNMGFIESPRYPSAYSRGIEKYYVLRNHDKNGFVRLVFDDFHLHPRTTFQILESDGSSIFNWSDSHRRPPALVSKGNQLTVHFHANDFTHVIGFRAKYEFVHDSEWPEQPNPRDCDETFESFGGEITLDVHTHLLNSHVDCIWTVGRLNPLIRAFDRVYVKVEDWHLRGVGLRLEIRDGPSSSDERLLLLHDQNTRDQLQQKQPRHGYSTSLSNPVYYIRLRGYLMSTSGLEIIYSQFYRWATPACPNAGELHCDNSRCIKASLRCDGIDHCGDGSDERCSRSTGATNYRDPGEADVSGILAFVVGVCVLIVMLISTTVMGRVYRRRLSLELRQRQEAIQTGTCLPDQAASIQTVGERRFYVLPEAQVAVIEAPPTYDDAMKNSQASFTTLQRRNQDNLAYVPSVSEEELHRPPSSVPPPPATADNAEDEPSSSGGSFDRSPRITMSPSGKLTPSENGTEFPLGPISAGTVEKNNPLIGAENVPSENYQGSSSESNTKEDKSEEKDESWV